jgi:hypothetical protein
MERKSGGGEVLDYYHDASADWLVHTEIEMKDFEMVL